MIMRDSLKQVAQYLAKLRHQRKTADEGDGRVNSFNRPTHGNNLQSGHILEVITIAQSLKLSRQFPDAGTNCRRSHGIGRIDDNRHLNCREQAITLVEN
jgi:hypothetical protein